MKTSLGRIQKHHQLCQNLDPARGWLTLAPFTGGNTEAEEGKGCMWSKGPTSEQVEPQSRVWRRYTELAFIVRTLVPCGVWTEPRACQLSAEDYSAQVEERPPAPQRCWGSHSIRASWLHRKCGWQNLTFIFPAQNLMGCCVLTRLENFWMSIWGTIP